MPTITFWFDFGSTYAYLSAMRIAELAAGAAVPVIWRPFLLGPIFADQGWQTSPFNIYPAKGRYMWRDMERLCQARGLEFVRPDPFPQHGLRAARVAQLALKTDRGAAFCREVFQAQFARGADISQTETLRDCLDRCALPAELLDRSGAPPNKAALRASTDAARCAGLFGAPSFTVDGELFWGDDRLEDALAWANAPHSSEGS
ncbi:MAG: 2-hydroxychromene-2-carboxylate isomerase [Rhodobacteraceae bacterium]|nr:2-hydroxychromene-2-carboxylate isomerase [Paracoccaceae bacterium]